MVMQRVLVALNALRDLLGSREQMETKVSLAMMVRTDSLANLVRMVLEGAEEIAETLVSPEFLANLVDTEVRPATASEVTVNAEHLEKQDHEEEEACQGLGATMALLVTKDQPVSPASLAMMATKARTVEQGLTERLALPVATPRTVPVPSGWQLRLEYSRPLEDTEKLRFRLEEHCSPQPALDVLSYFPCFDKKIKDCFQI